MGTREIQRLRKTLTGIYAVWHACGLRKGERGLRKGRLCDVCLDCIEADILQVSGPVEVEK